MDKLTDDGRRDIEQWARLIGFWTAFEQGRKTEAKGGVYFTLHTETLKLYANASYGTHTLYVRPQMNNCEIQIAGRGEIITDQKVHTYYEYAIAQITELPWVEVARGSLFESCSCCGIFARLVEHEETPICRHCDNKMKSYKPDNSGFVYVFGDNALGIYKIGCTAKLNVRIKTLNRENAASPLHNELICSVPTPDKYKTERELHRKFASKNKRGEWFTLDAQDIEYIKGLAQ